jgi:hypothetical protein
MKISVCATDREQSRVGDALSTWRTPSDNRRKYQRQSKTIELSNSTIIYASETRLVASPDGRTRLGDQETRGHDPAGRVARAGKNRRVEADKRRVAPGTRLPRVAARRTSSHLRINLVQHSNLQKTSVRKEKNNVQNGRVRCR